MSSAEAAASVSIWNSLQSGSKKERGVTHTPFRWSMFCFMFRCCQGIVAFTNAERNSLEGEPGVGAHDGDVIGPAARLDLGPQPRKRAQGQGFFQAQGNGPETLSVTSLKFWLAVVLAGLSPWNGPLNGRAAAQLLFHSHSSLSPALLSIASTMP